MNTVDCGVEGGFGELVDLSKLELSSKPEASGHATEEIGELAIGDHLPFGILNACFRW